MTMVDTWRMLSEKELVRLHEREADLREQVELLREALYAVQWVDLGDEDEYPLCPECNETVIRGHASRCRVGYALEEATA